MNWEPDDWAEFKGKLKDELIVGTFTGHYDDLDLVDMAAEKTLAKVLGALKGKGIRLYADPKDPDRIVALNPPDREVLTPRGFLDRVLQTSPAGYVTVCFISDKDRKDQ